jgi:5'(3')-deoxyribonucleotidase
MNDQQIVAIDMDDVVVESAPAIINYVNQKYGAKATLDNFYSRDPSIWGAPDAGTAIKRVNSFIETKDFLNLPPVQEALHAIRNIKKEYKLYIVTGRPDFVELATRKWLEKYLPDVFEDVVFTNYFDAVKVRTKGDICKELGVTILIDDHLDHCLSAQSKGIKALLFGNYPWNQADTLPDGIHRVKHWPDVEAVLLNNGK